MTNYNKAIIALQNFAESRDLYISLHYKKSEFIEDWLKENDRVWQKDLDFLLASSENLISEISGELIFFICKFNDPIWEQKSEDLSLNPTVSNQIIDEIFYEEPYTYPTKRMDTFQVIWEIKSSSLNKLFDHFIVHQRLLEKAMKFKDELLINLEFFKEKEGTPPFAPKYSNINKIPTWGSINKTVGIFALLIKHDFLLIKDIQKNKSNKKKFTPDQFKKINSTAIAKDKFAEIIANTFFNVKIEDGNIKENAISSLTISKKLKDSIIADILDDDIDDMITDLNEMIIEFEKMVQFLKREKENKVKNKI
jgi:hypothetical protein